MRLLQSEELDVLAKGNRADDEIPAVEIVHQGKSTGIQVSGAVLEAAVQISDQFILFLTDDVPYEEMLNIHLLNSGFNVLDSVIIGSIYSTGSFSDLQLIEPDELQFRFIGETDWRLQLLPGPEFALPFISEPKGVQRKFGFKRHFKIFGKPVANV